MITGIKNLLTSLWVKTSDFFVFKKFISFFSFGFVTLVLVLSFLASSLSPIKDLKTQKAEAATSSTLNFQARLLNSSGNLVADGYYNIRFKLYDGGTQGGGAGKGQTLGGTQLWTESYYDSNGVTVGNDNRVRVVNGYFSVNLGSQTAFPSINWDEELWLTMDIGGTTQTATPTYDGEMLSSIPAANSRLKLTAVPYAFRAGQLAKTTGTYNSTLDFAAQTASRSILLPDADGTVCLQGATACGFAASTGAAGYIQNSTSLQTTANFNIQSAAAGSVGGVIRAASSQTADLFQLQDSSGVILTAFDATGKLVFGPSGSQDTNLYRSAANTLRTDDSLIVTGNITGNGNVLLQNTTNSTNALQIQNSTGTTLLTADTTAQKLTVNTGQLVARSTFTNLVTNPSLETNLTGWTWDPVVGSPFTFAQTGSWSSSGTTAGHYQVNSAGYGDVVTPTGTSGYPVTAGTTYTGQAVVNVVQAHGSGVQIRINWYNSGGTFISSSTSAAQTGTGVKDLSITAAAPGGATYASFALGVVTPGSLATVQFYWDSVQLIAHDSSLEYFDGSLSGSYWNGTAHGSTSTRASLLAGASIFKNTTDSTGAFQIQNAAGTSLLSVDTTSSTLGIASSASAATVNIGNTTGASALNLRVGTGNFTLNGAAASTYDLGSSTVAGTIAIGGTAQTGTMTLGRSTASNTISIGSNVGGSNTQTINLGTSSTASSTTNVNIGSSIAGTTAITGATTITNRTSGSADTLIVSNSTSTGTIFVARDNSTAVMTIADGGATTFRTATNTSDAYAFQNSSGDNVLGVGTTAYSSVNTNLILNSSFEGGAGGWSGKNGASNSSGSISTSASAYLGSGYGTIPGSAIGHGKSYAVTLSASTTYNFSIYVKLASGTMTTLVLGHQDQSGTDIDDCVLSSTTINTSWQRVSCNFTTGGTISSSNVYVKQSDATSRTIHIDAAQLTLGSGVRSVNNGEFSVDTTISRRLVVAGYTSGTGQMFEVQNQAGTQIFGVDTDSNTTIIAGIAAVNGGDLTTDDTTFNLLNSTATTINFGGGATTALNIGPTGATGTSINLAGGSAATGCTVDGATGNLTCSGNITGSSSGTVGYWSRSGATLQPATAGDAITTSGAISTTSTGTITSAGLLTANGGLTVETGDTFTMNGDAFTDLTGSGLVVSSNALTVDATSSTGFFRNGGNSFSGAATIGTNDGNVLNVETNNNTRFQVSASASTLTGQGTTILTSTGTLDLSSAAASNLSITTGTTGTLALDTGTTGGITIGNNANAKTITVGNSTGATAVNLQAGTNGVSIAANGIANTVQIGNTSGAVTQSINIGTNSTASSTNNVNIGSSVAGTTAITGATTITNRTSGSAATLIVSNSTSTGSIFVARDNATDVMSIADGGATTFSNTNTSAFVIQNASSQTLLVANTSTQQLAVGPAAVPGNGVLTVGTNTTAASGGIYFGTDINLYRYNNTTLASDDHIASTAGSFFTAAANQGFLFGATSGMINTLANGTGALELYNGSANSIASFNQAQGAAIFRNHTNSSTAFQIQSATGTDTMFIVDTTNTNKIKIGNSTGTGNSTTVFQLDGAASAPFGTGQTAYLGSMYYDTTQGKLQCYENRNGTASWGACGSAPNNIITLTPEYTGAVLNGTGVGTMTADFCSNEAGVLTVGTLCANHETRNFYKWTSPQGTNQTYSIYVNYKLPTTFNSFEDANTIKLTALTDSTSNASATLQVFRKNVSGNTISSCGSATTINSSASTWQQTSFGGNETTCGFVGGDYVIFKIDVTARSGANIYVENLDFTYRNT